MYLIYRGPPESPWETMIKRMDLIKRTKTIIKTISHLQTVQKNTYPYCYGADTALSNLSNLSTQIWFSTPSFRVFETQTTVIMEKRDWLPNKTYTTGVLADLSPRTDLVLTWDEVEQLGSTLHVVQHRDGQLLLDRGRHLLLHPWELLVQRVALRVR